MRSTNLAKLEQLSEEQADLSQRAVERHQRELQQVGRHHHELSTINSEYQNSVVGQDAVSPRLLAHRRAFVAQLSIKLDELKLQKHQKSLELKVRMQEHSEHAMQTAAIGTMVEREQARERIQELRLEQRQQDEASQGMRRVHMINEGDGHV